MISTTALVATCLVCLIAGAGIGALIMRVVIAKQTPKDLESKYNALQTEFQQYQQDVAQHFVDSSRFQEKDTENPNKGTRNCSKEIKGDFIMTPVGTTDENTKWILVADDEPSVRQFVERALNYAGYAVKCGSRVCLL